MSLLIEMYEGQFLEGEEKNGGVGVSGYAKKLKDKDESNLYSHIVSGRLSKKEFKAFPKLRQ